MILDLALVGAFFSQQMGRSGLRLTHEMLFEVAPLFQKEEQSPFETIEKKSQVVE